MVAGWPCAPDVCMAPCRVRCTGCERLCSSLPCLGCARAHCCCCRSGWCTVQQPSAGHVGSCHPWQCNEAVHSVVRCRCVRLPIVLQWWTRKHAVTPYLPTLVLSCHQCLCSTSMCMCMLYGRAQGTLSVPSACWHLAPMSSKPAVTAVSCKLSSAVY